jgi:hypothetical protein
MYACPICHKAFDRKFCLDRHLNKKNKCISNKENDDTESEVQKLRNEINEMKKFIYNNKTKKKYSDSDSDNNNENSHENNNAKQIIRNSTISNSDVNIASNNITNSNNNISQNVMFNFQYINKNFPNAKNLEDLVKEENITDEMYQQCKKTYINDGAEYIMKKLCIDDIKIEDRAIHCLDASRRNYAVKTQDIWHRDTGGKVAEKICEPVIRKVYRKINKEHIKENKFSLGTIIEFGEKANEYSKNGFKKTLDNCASELDQKKYDYTNQLKKENVVNIIENDLYDDFLNTKTQKSYNHIHTTILYAKFTEWFKDKYPNKKIPSNREFILNIKKYHTVYKSVKSGDKISCGIKNLELK